MNHESLTQNIKKIIGLFKLMQYLLNDPNTKNTLKEIRNLLDNIQLSSDTLLKIKSIAQYFYQQNPHNIEILEIMLEVYFLENNLQKVIEYIKVLQNIAPNNSITYYFFGKIFKTVKNYPYAIANFQKALELKCSKPDLISLLITTYIMAKDKEKAISNYLIYAYPDSSQREKRQILITQIIRAEEYCQRHNKFFKMIHNKQKIELEIKGTIIYPDKEIKAGKNDKNFYYVSESYIACLENVLVIPPNYTVITDNGYHIYDGLDTNSRVSMLLMEPYKFHTTDDQVLVDIPKEELVIDEEVILFGGGVNFSHCINDWMSKLYILEQYQEINHLPLLVSTNCPSHVLELFDLFGIGKSRIRKIDNTAVLKCKKLWIPSLTHQFQHISPDYLNYFTNKISQIAKKDDRKKRLYFSRENATCRRLTNQNELWKILEKYDFEKIIPERYSIWEQINLCYNAEIIICIIGGASAALLFTAPDTVFIELTNPAIHLSQNLITATLKGNPFYQVIGNTEPINRGRFTFDIDFNIPINRIESILENLFS
ncbi:MAG: glycosyltransferase 61 family protein [bacterium]|nr:glycosyltransferase 61 family protein [bacterium]